MTRLQDFMRLDETSKKLRNLEDEQGYIKHQYMVSGDIVRKSAHVIMAREKEGLNGNDRKLFNFLMTFAYSSNDIPLSGLHQTEVSRVLSYLGHDDYRRLNESLKRLSDVRIEIDYIDMDGNETSVGAHYLSYNMVLNKTGKLKFAFDDILLDFMYSPKVYASLSLNAMRGFKSSYSAKLYEILALYANRQKREWYVDIDMFRSLLGVEKNYSRLDNLRRSVIDISVAEINQIAPFLIDVEDIRKGKGGKISAFCFSIHAKDVMTMKILDDQGILSKSRRGKRDKNTIDLLRNKTDEELSKQLISEDVMQIARSKTPDKELVNQLYNEWVYKFFNIKSDLNTRDREFLTWFDIQLSKIERKKAEDVSFTCDDAVHSLITGWKL